MEWKWSNAGDLALDVIGFIPLVGDGVKAIKKVPFKEIGNGIKKGVKEIPDIWKNIKNGIKNFVGKFSKKGVQEVTKETSKEILQKETDTFRQGLENVINQILPKQKFSFADIGDIVDDVIKNSDINRISNSGRGVEINSNNNNNNFVGKLRDELVVLNDVTTIENFNYIKRNTDDLKKLRNEFNTTKRKEFLKYLAESRIDLKSFGFSDSDILKIKDGKVPNGWQVHHKLPLDDGGTNDFENLVLIKNEPYHKVLTNYQNSLVKNLKPGESVTIKWPIPNGKIYPQNLLED